MDFRDVENGIAFEVDTHSLEHGHRKATAFKINKKEAFVPQLKRVVEFGWNKQVSGISYHKDGFLAVDHLDRLVLCYELPNGELMAQVLLPLYNVVLGHEQITRLVPKTTETEEGKPNEIDINLDGAKKHIGEAVKLIEAAKTWAKM